MENLTDEEIDFFFSKVYPIMKKILSHREKIKKELLTKINKETSSCTTYYKEINRIKREINDVDYILTLDFTSDELFYIYEKINFKYKPMLKKIYNKSLLAPRLSWLSEEERDIFKSYVHPYMKKIIKKSGIRRKSNLCKYEENQFLDSKSILLLGLEIDNPCESKLSIEELTYIFDNNQDSLTKNEKCKKYSYKL